MMIKSELLDKVDPLHSLVKIGTVSGLHDKLQIYCHCDIDTCNMHIVKMIQTMFTYMYHIY